MNLNYPKSSLLSTRNKLITLQDNTLVYFNGSNLLLNKAVKINVLYNDGNITSFNFKCPNGFSCVPRFSQPLISNYMVIVCNKANKYNGMIVRSDGKVVHESIPISLHQQPLLMYQDFKLFVN